MSVSTTNLLGLEMWAGDLKHAGERQRAEQLHITIREITRLRQLEAENAKLREALEKIANPVLHMQRQVPEGHRFDGAAALALVTPAYLQESARDALKPKP